MKCLERNKKTFYYCLYTGQEPVYDDDKNDTGEQSVVFGNPVRCIGNISPATGNSSVEQFGNNLQYDKVIVLDDPNCPIDEHSVLFVDKEPDEELLFDYIVKKVARSINSVSIAIAKVDVS